jgi:transaldolase
MRILLATADAAEMEWAAQRQWADGVFVTPPLIAQESAGGEAPSALAEASRITGGPVYVAVRAVHPEEIYQESRELARSAEQTILVLPFQEEVVPLIARLGSEGIGVAASFVHSGAQALLAAKAGASAVIVPFADHDRFGHSGHDVLADVSAVIRASRLECDVVATGLRAASDVVRCAHAGADALILDPQVLRAFVQHPLTDRGFDVYLSELARLARPRVS